jgi:tetratricopeptide (TPR) repeat protein
MGDTWGIAVSLHNLGNVALYQGEYANASTLLEESLGHFRSLGDTRGVAYLLFSLGQVAQYQGDYSRAVSLYEQSLAMGRDLGDKWGRAASLLNLGIVAHEQGEVSRALGLHNESLALFLQLGDKWGIACGLEGVAGALGALGQAEEGARLFAAAAALRQTIGAPVPPADQARHERHLTLLRAVLGEGAFDAAWQEGATFHLEDATARALAAGPHGIGVPLHHPV